MTGAPQPSLVFWFEFASPYSYLAAFRIEAAAKAASIDHVWQPFLLAPIFAHRGFADSPFNLDTRRGDYMWRDIERLCARDDIGWRRPAVFPRSGLLAARVATAVMSEPWGRAFCRAVFRANFAEDRDITAAATIGEILRELGQQPDVILARAAAPDTKEALRVATADAEALGVFGAPTFQVGSELFWGQDRLVDAVAWAARGKTP
jgi:2-hydroxychromene-2-carboxylate isomerase